MLLVGLMTSCGDDTESASFDYALNGDYAGDHADDLTATLILEENEEGNTVVTVELTNTVEGAMYPIHAHDAADPATTPNMTLILEMPNAAVLAGAIMGTGGTVTLSQVSEMSFTDVNNFDGFLVVHDPLQAVNTTDPTTLLIVSAFAR